MNIAILKNDSVIEELRKDFPDYDQMIMNWIQYLNHKGREGWRDIRFTVYDMVEREKPRFDHDLYISSGSRKSVYEEHDWIRHFHDTTLELHEKRRPHFGICFGHQMIALALGAKVGKASGWGVGIHTWETEGNVWEKDSLSLWVSHQDQVQGMTSDMKLILKSDFCPIAGFTVDRHIMAVQGHPEFSTDYVSAIMEIRKSIYPEGVYHQGKESLNIPTDEKYLLQVIDTFFFGE